MRETQSYLILIFFISVSYIIIIEFLLHFMYASESYPGFRSTFHFEYALSGDSIVLHL